MKTFDDYFEIIRFATPESNVRFKEKVLSVPKSGDIIIKSCFNWEDVMHLIMADKILTRNNIICTWYIPYKPFARQDRTTGLGHATESGMLYQLIQDHLKVERVIFLDVHSDLWPIGHKIHQFAPIRYYMPFGNCKTGTFNQWEPSFHLIVPDKGARNKIPRAFHSGQITYCDKTRDPVTGKLSGFIVPNIELRYNRPLVLVDDICDGGGTFIGIGKELQKYRKSITLILYITHGLFTKGVEELLKYFDCIVTTNSVCSIDNDNGSTFKVLDVLSDDFVEFGLKEFNLM